MLRPFLLITLALMFWSCEDQKEKTAQRLYDAAIALSERNEFEKALEVLQRVRVNYPETRWATRAEDQIDTIQGLQNMLMQSLRTQINQRFTRIALALENYKRRYRSYPITVEDLKKLPSEHVPEFVDEYGNKILFRSYASEGVSELEPDKYALACYGADGLPGGKGKDSDYFYQNGKEVSRLNLP